MNTKPFIMAAKAFVCDGQGRYLFLRRSAQSKRFAGYWELPGGKVNPGEGIDQALAREVLEETGLRVADPHVAGATEGDTPAARFVFVIMEVQAQPGEVRLSEEHDQYAWATPDEAARLQLSPIYIDCVRELVNRTTVGRQAQTKEGSSQ